MKLHLGLALRIRKKINNRRCCYLFELLQNSEISPTVLTTVSFAAFSVVNFRTRTSCPEIPWFNPVSQCLLSFFPSIHISWEANSVCDLTVRKQILINSVETVKFENSVSQSVSQDLCKLPTR